MMAQLDFYPRPPRGGRHHLPAILILGDYISTHALREEGDKNTSDGWDTSARISTHALREEGDVDQVGQGVHKALFLPTPSARRATAMLVFGAVLLEISTHALREEGDHGRV